MKDQHTHITGYRDLTRQEIDLMNEIKATGAKLGELIERMEALPAVHADGSYPAGEAIVIDRRWLAIGKTDIQKGAMAVIRSVTKPSSFC